MCQLDTQLDGNKEICNSDIARVDQELPISNQRNSDKRSGQCVLQSQRSPKISQSRKQPKQSCFIPNSAIKADGIYPRVSGKGLCYSESLPEVLMDSRLIWRTGKWYLALPRKEQRVPYGDNQARVVAIDPGVRTFVIFYSDEQCGHIGEYDFSRIQRLQNEQWINRDEVGARNILLRALVDSPDSFSVAVARTC